MSAIQPSSIDTDTTPATGPFFEQMSAIIVFKRYCKRDEIANLAAFLAYHEASFTTVSAINVDGDISL